MKVEKLDHLHIYVRELDKAAKLFSELLGTKFSDPIYVDEIKAKSMLEPFGIELLESTSDEGVVGKAINRKGEGLFAVSFKVSNIDEAIKRFESKGIRVVGRVEIGNLKEVQFHPKDTHGVMIELCEYDPKYGTAIAATEMI